MAIRPVIVFSIIVVVYLALSVNAALSYKTLNHRDHIYRDSDTSGKYSQPEKRKKNLLKGITKEKKLSTTPGDDIDPCDRDCSIGGTMTCSYQWTIEYTYLNPDGCDSEDCISRPLITVNEQIPGPKIIVCKGDTIVVEVTNKMEDDAAITIHWHGLRQYHTPTMDGVPMVTQYPILYGMTCTYEMIADVGGTYFWHSHVGVNRGDGIAGPLIIREADDPHLRNYDEDRSDHILFVQDGMNILQFLHYLKYIYGGGNQPDFLLINGKDKFVNNLEVLHVEKDKSYRMRLINNAISGCDLQLSIDQHKLLAIAMDGYPIKSVDCDVLVITAGERIDFVLAATEPTGNYWLRLKGIGNNCASMNLQQLAIVRYDSADTADPAAPKRAGSDEFETACNVPIGSTVNATEKLKLSDIRSIVPLDQDEIDADPETHYLEVAMKKITTKYDRSNFPLFNGLSFMVPPYPLLISNYSLFEEYFFFIDGNEEAPDHCETEQCAYIHTLETDLDEVVEMFFFNNGKGQGCHPMHLHGHTYYVVGMGDLTADTNTREQIEEKDNSDEPFERNLFLPVHKDTACLAANSYMIVRFKADNPGWWFLHCHMDYHALLGMAIVVRVGDESDVQEYLTADACPLSPSTMI